MQTKKIIWIITGCILFSLLAGCGYLFFMKHKFAPGIKNLSKQHIGIIYCSYNDSISDIVNIIGEKLQADKIKLEPAIAYSKDSKEFTARVKQENANLDKVILKNDNINVKNYNLLIFWTSFIKDKPCPAIQKFVLDNKDSMIQKPYSMLILYNENENPKNTVQFFVYKLYHSIRKPSFITRMKSKDQLDYEIKLWFDQMQFTREELK